MGLLTTILINGIVFAGTALEQSGKGIKIWFDTGGPVGGPYNTIVQNGAEQAVVDLGCKVDYIEITPEIDKDASLGTPVITAYLSANSDCDIVKPDEIIGAGFSLSPATASAIKSGYVDLVGDGQPYLQGYLPIFQIVMAKRFGFSGLEIETGGGFIHKGNIDLIAPLAKKGIR